MSCPIGLDGERGDEAYAKTIRVNIPNGEAIGAKTGVDRAIDAVAGYGEGGNVTGLGKCVDLAGRDDPCIGIDRQRKYLRVAVKRRRSHAAALVRICKRWRRCAERGVELAIRGITLQSKHGRNERYDGCG